MVRWIHVLESSRLIVSAVIDLTGPDHHNSNYPLICAQFSAKPLPDDNEDKGKHPPDTYVQFKGRGRYKPAKCV